MNKPYGGIAILTTGGSNIKFDKKLVNSFKILIVTHQWFLHFSVVEFSDYIQYIKSLMIQLSILVKIWQQ